MSKKGLPTITAHGGKLEQHHEVEGGGDGKHMKRQKSSVGEFIANDGLTESILKARELYTKTNDDNVLASLGRKFGGELSKAFKDYKDS
jgi:hypothetical protein